MVLTYSFAMSYPLGSYLEYPFLVIQGMYYIGALVIVCHTTHSERN